MQIVSISPTAPDSAEAYPVLESGGIVLFPGTAFDIPEADRQILLSMRQAGGGFHKNIAYRPAQDRLSGLGKTTPEAAARVRDIMRSYSRRAVEFTGSVLPRYRRQWQLDFASFRPLEEEGRALPWKKRNDLLHVDAFPTRPTNGDLILRVFTNIHPEKQRVWVTSDPFEPLAQKWAAAAGLDRIAARSSSLTHRFKHGIGRFARRLGMRVADRSPYDEFMLGFHDYLKQNDEYQQKTPKYRFEFAPGATWMVFTDVVPHSVLSGQYALEQTFLVARDSLASPDRAPVSILERLARQRLTHETA